MVKLLIIADDFTGAFDTGVQFAAKGAATTVVTDTQYSFQDLPEQIDVLVVVSETRHLPPQKAYDIVYDITARARRAGVPNIYKKTDSALRGNVGSELAALMAAAEIEALPFLPALPKLHRITRDGVHYVNGVPVAESVFGQDLFEPVLDSRVTDILHRQTDVPLVNHHLEQTEGISRPGIQIFDAETDEDLMEIGRRLGAGQLQFCAGCAGFAAVLAELLGVNGQPQSLPPLADSFFVCCGSVNPVSRTQMDTARQAGFVQAHLLAEQKLDPHWPASPEAGECIRRWLAQAERQKRFILDVNDPPDKEHTPERARQLGLTREELRLRISDNLAALMKRLLDEGLRATLLCTGGDTLLAFMQALGVTQMSPICEMETGVVLTRFTYRGESHHIITKAGGFGAPNLLVTLADKIIPPQ